MIDPISIGAALAAVQSAIGLVKQAAAVADDVASLGPMLGKYFDAKAKAVEVVEASRKGDFEGSALGQALELELALEQAAEFERQIQGLFFSANKMDVWQRIKDRQANIEREQAHAARRKKEAAARKKRQDEEAMTIVLGIVVLVVVLGTCGWFIWGVLEHCQKVGCGG